MARSSYAQALLGEETYERVKTCKLLVVGAGGIGCELLKNLVLVGFGNIEIIDLDTIDLSNLNRQFLFRKPDIKKPKAIVAAASASHFNPNSGIAIHPRHGNVKDGQNDAEWIKGFDLVLNALDNMDARRHVNRLCCAANVPLIESGTAGYLGQVTPIQKDKTECFDCVTKPTPKSFPVCTIRSTPSEPIHCIVWGKSYLFGQLFGEDDEEADAEELDKAKAAGENAAEIENLKKEAHAFREVRKGMGEEDGARKVFEKVFQADINRLLSMEDMWNVPGRVKPVALDYEAIVGDSFVTPPVRKVAKAKEGDAPAAPAPPPSGAGLKDQKELSVKENLELFIDSCNRLSARAISHPSVPLAFDKDDDDTLDFVLATANLRAIAYGIETKTRFQVKEMAGNIIPAIATTNAIIAGLIVMQAVQLLKNNWSEATNIHLRSDASRPLGALKLSKPDEECGICRDTYITLQCDPSKLTLGEFVEKVVWEWLRYGKPAEVEEEEDAPECSVFEGSRLLADPDFTDNYSKTLAEMGIEQGKMVTVVDEDGNLRNAVFSICDLPADAQTSFVIPALAPSISQRPAAPVKRAESSPPPQPVAGIKRALPQDDADQEGLDKKKQKVEDEQSAVVVDDDDFEILP